MHDAGTIVQRLIARYRRRIALRASAGMVAGLACAGLLALRLRQAGLPDGRIALFSGAVLALTAAWVWRSIQHGRSRRVSLVADLDRALGMDARLLTAVEFADAPEPPALYPRLLEETAKALPDVQRRLPSVIDRPGAVLAVAALLLLLWPHAGPRTQLAMTPPALMPPEVPPITPPEPPPQPQQNQQSQQQNQQPQPQQNQQNQQNQQQKNQSGGQQPQPQGGSQDKQQKQQQSGEQSKSQDQQGKGSQQSQQQSSEQSKQSGKDSKSGGGKDGQQADAEQLAKSDKTSASKAGANPGSPSDAAAQQALKADIQQLLKEMSSELKQMQAELEAKQSNSKEPSPLAGGATDPDRKSVV